MWGGEWRERKWRVGREVMRSEGEWGECREERMETEK